MYERKLKSVWKKKNPAVPWDARNVFFAVLQRIYRYNYYKFSNCYIIILLDVYRAYRLVYRTDYLKISYFRVVDGK